jgi:hypothetical protein
MRTADLRAALAALAVLCTAGRAEASIDPRIEASAAEAVDLARDLWALVRQLQADGDPPAHGAERRLPPLQPQALAPAGPDGPTVDIADLSDPTLLEPRLRELAARAGSDLRITVPGGTARIGPFSVGSGESVDGHRLVLRGDADVYGKLLGNLVTVDGDVTVHPGAVVSGDILALGGEVLAGGGEIGGVARQLGSPSAPAGADEAVAPPLSPALAALRNVAGVIGVFLTLCGLGFGLVMFGQRNLEVVSDTVSHSFGRALITGLIGQILILPTFGMLVVGLILSVAGILLLPFAVAVYGLLVVVCVVGGYLAVAHAMGETYIRRRLAQGATMGSPNSYRYLLVGLAGLLGLWAAWAIFGWVPIAGDLIRAAAVLVTWLLGTVGFGAALLSRAGVRENFAGRLIPPEALTDEYLWATPQFGVPAVRRPGHRTPSSGL